MSDNPFDSWSGTISVIIGVPLAVYVLLAMIGQIIEWVIPS